MPIPPKQSKLPASQDESQDEEQMADEIQQEELESEGETARLLIDSDPQSLHIFEAGLNAHYGDPESCQLRGLVLTLESDFVKLLQAGKDPGERLLSYKYMVLFKKSCRIL